MTKPHSKSLTDIFYLQYDVSSHLVNTCTYENSSKMFLLFCTLCPIEIGRFVFPLCPCGQFLGWMYRDILCKKKASRKKTDLKLCIILFPMSHPQRAREADPKYLKGYSNHNWQWIEYFFFNLFLYTLLWVLKQKRCLLGRENHGVYSYVWVSWSPPWQHVLCSEYGRKSNNSSIMHLIHSECREGAHGIVLGSSI